MNPVSVVADSELERHITGVIVVAVVAAQLGLGAFIAGHGVVKGEADGVEDAGFARSGFPGNEEDAVRGEPIEVNRLNIFVWAKSGNFEVVDPHAVTDALSSAAVACSVMTAAITARSASVGPTPFRTCSRNPATISPSVLDLSRSA